MDFDTKIEDVDINSLLDTVDTTDVTFELTNDIDMEGVSFRGIGDSNYSFGGTFNGNDHVISNLTINTTEDNVGLFGSASFCSIKKLYKKFSSNRS